ncbi:hypothetical protein M9Y10_040530 [Tritrichomonas musculus]|uniref:Protein kinase domain-containing protein n=1 Tax=Tritrichomonas musculus TaxID=1915356 RepID=A0ABR2GQQ4_9EUKA
MENGETFFTKIFSVKKDLNNTQKKSEIARRIIKFAKLKIPLKYFRSIVAQLENVKDIDSVKDYFKSLKVDLCNSDEQGSDLNDLIQMTRQYLNAAEEKIQKLNQLDPFISFLTLECKDNINGDINDFINLINCLKEEKSKVIDILSIDTHPDKADIKKLLNLENALKIPFNVFNRFLIKQLFKNNKIDSAGSLINAVEKIDQNCKNIVGLNALKKLRTHKFDHEIIKVTQDLMLKDQNKFSITDTNDSNLVYKHIESSYLKFDKLSEDDKKFLHTLIVRVLHFENFNKLGNFFTDYFAAKDRNKDRLQDIECFINHFEKTEHLIREFSEFSTFCQNTSKDDLFNFQITKFMEEKNIKWPKLDKNIEIEQTSQFFTFWNCVGGLVSSYISDENNESLMITEMSEFLNDKNKFTKFLQKMQQAYIEPTNKIYYVIFESVMKMLIKSDIANKDSNFIKVSKNASNFFADEANRPEYYKVSTGFKALLYNEKKIISLLNTEAIIEEYKFVKKVIDGESTWEISFQNHIRLVEKDKITADFPKLRLITAKLNIVMIETQNISNLEESMYSDKFVKFFQTAEALYSKISILHQLKFDIADKVYKYDLMDTSKINELINNFSNLTKAVNDFISNEYKDELCIFTKEHLFALYQLFNRYINDYRKGKSSDLGSIFSGTIISLYHDDFYDLFRREDFDAFILKDNFNDGDIEQFKKNLNDFSEVLKNIIVKLKTKFKKNFDKNVPQLRNTPNLDEYLIGGTVRCICLYPNCTNRDEYQEGEFSAKAQLHSMMLYLLYKYRDPAINALPLPTQLLICSMSMTRSQIDSFLGYFDSMTVNEIKCMFIVVSPIQLQPELYDYLISRIMNINETIISQSRIVILYENEDYTRKPAFNDIIRKISVDHFKPVTKIEALKGLYTIDGYYGIQCYYIYQPFPRTGKTHRILSHIYENFKGNHVYTRILVDEATTLTTLINRLNAIPKDPKGKSKIIIHFNVDGKCSTDFHLYIQNLAFFRSLNDGVSTPFIANNQMVFYFEFGSRPSFNHDQFIQDIFPIARYIEEIKIPETRDFFTYTEYVTKPHREIPNAFEIDIKPFNRKHLIDAATIARLNYNEDSFLRVQKSALHDRYLDYIDYYQRLYDHLKAEPKDAYDYLLKMFENLPDKERLLISQISDVARVISRFKGPIMSQTVYEKGVGYNVRRFLAGLLIEAAITNCGLPYMPPMEGDKIIDSSEKDEQRLKRIKKFISKHGYMLTICNPAGSADDQTFSLIINEELDFIKLLVELDYLPNDSLNVIKLLNENKIKKNDEKIKKINEIKNAIKSALNVVDPDWKKQECPDELFKILADILNLQYYEKDKYNITMMVNIWRSLSDDDKDKLQKEWEENIEGVKKDARDNHKIVYSQKIREIYKDTKNKDPNFLRRKKIWYDVQDQLLNEKLFDINEVEYKQNKQNTIFVSKNIYQFISNCEKYIQNADSLTLKYTLTSQNIKRFVHLVYRIYSNVPIVLMGETGSGKTFTLQFLSEIIGKNVELIHRVIDGSTKEESLRAFLNAKIQNLTFERSCKLKDKLKKAAEDPKTPAAIVASIQFLTKDDMAILSDFDDIKIGINEFIRDQDRKKLIQYGITVDEEVEGFKNYILYNLNKLYREIELEQKSYLFFFDEVNTAPCQWFIKEIILDRYFEGKILPNYIHFVCAVNPSRRLNNNLENVLDALNPIYDDDSQDKRKNLAYKVGQMPESFVPYLFPSDPNRNYGSYNSNSSDKKNDDEERDDEHNKKDLFDINFNSEFDVSIDKKVESEFSIMTYPFVTELTSKDNFTKIGDKHHFSATNMFSTSFDYTFFNALFNDSKKSLVYSRSLTRVLSRINIFCCRLSHHVIYKDESFSSIRDPERCIRIMRWAYKFGIYEKLEDNLNFKKAIKRLRRAFIIGLSVSFWIRLSDQKPSPHEDSFRKKFIDNVCEFWENLLGWDAAAEVKDSFPAPTYNEWKDIINEECKKYADIFVDDDECVSKNEALSENIWVSFICIMNNIPLWIIGKTGTSKSLAISIVINKLLSQNSRSEKITKCPHLVSQTFMCSNITTTEAIMDQLGKIVDRSNMYNNNYIIRIQILENVGHADMSRLKPLVCLHNIIDNGYPFRPGISIPVLLIGLSNYKMDSAKLNRGILLLRCSLNDYAIKKTASDIFKSTNLAWNQNNIYYNEASDEKKIIKYDKQIQEVASVYQDEYKNSDDKEDRPFIGLRDFYGLIQSLTKPLMSGNIKEKDILTIVRRNFSGIPFNKKLRNEKTSGIIKSIMEKLFKGTVFRPNNRFNKLILQNENPDKEDAKKVTIYYKMSQLIEDNLNQEHRILKTPIFRHILISTINAAALLILVQNKAIKLPHYKDKGDSPYELFFSANMSNLPDAEWISNEIRRLTEIMYKGKIAVFIGNHPCFDCLYDIFNLRYQKDCGYEELFVALISYGGYSCQTRISSNFKAIIILESDVYKSLPQPFLNRFEKFNMTYKTELLPSEISKFENDIKSLKRKLQINNLSSAFGCYSDELLLSIYHIKNSINDETISTEQLMLLSIRPSSLVHSYRNGLSFTRKLIKSSLYENANLHSSLLHLLHGYNKNPSQVGHLSAHFYKIWKKNNGIKSIIMLPFFNNIDKITGYEFIRIDSSNSVDIDTRIKAEISQKEKHEKPLIISILISQSKLSIEVILQYEFILESIKGWCVKEEKIVKQPIHTLILISMEHNIENLKINQSIEWPLLYLDTCYDYTIKTKNNNNLPLDVSQLLFSPIRTLVKGDDEESQDDESIDNGLIDMDELFKKARQSIIPCYTEDENKLIDSVIFAKRYLFNFVIKKPIINLITKITDEESNHTAIEFITDDFHDLWSFKQITLLSSPPSSIIEFLSIKLVKVIGDIMGIIFELLLSGIDPRNPIDNNITFMKADIFCFMMKRPEFANLFFWILNGDSNQVYPIDHRYTFDIKLPGQLSFYKFIWQIATNINNIENFDKPSELHEEINKRLFQLDYEADISIVEDEFNKIMNSELDSNKNSDCFPFIAAFLLNTANSVRVDYNQQTDFTSWVSIFIEILKKLYTKEAKNKEEEGGERKLTMELMLHQLSSFNELITLAHDFTIGYMFIPKKSELEAFYDSLVLGDILEDIKKSNEEYPASRHIYTEEAHLIHLITDNFSKTMKDKQITIIQANDLFRNGFTTLLARHNSLNYNEDYIEDFSYKYRPFSLISSLQQFFIQFGDYLFVEEGELALFTISAKFTEEEDGLNCIKKFINDNYKFLKFKEGEKIDKNILTSIISMFYLETYNQVYQGLVDQNIDDFDPYGGGEEEEDEYFDSLSEKKKEKEDYFDSLSEKEKEKEDYFDSLSEKEKEKEEYFDSLSEKKKEEKNCLESFLEDKEEKEEYFEEKKKKDDDNESDFIIKKTIMSSETRSTKHGIQIESNTQETNQELESLILKNCQLEKENCHLKERVVQLEKEVSQISGNFIQMQSNICQTIDENKKLRKYSSSLQEEITQLNKRIQLTSNENNLLKKDLSSLKEENTHLNKRIQLTSNENNQLKKDSSSLQEEITQLNKRIQLTSNENNQLKKDLSSLKEENTHLNKRIQLTSNENNQLKKDSSSLQEEITQLNKRIQLTSNENNQLKKDLSSLKEENAILNKKIQLTSNENNQLKKDSSSLKEENTKLKEKIQLMSNEKDMLRKYSLSLREEITKVKDSTEKNQLPNNGFRILDEEEIKNLERLEEIGFGGGGKVTKVAMKKLYALKEMTFKNLEIKNIQNFINEYEIMNMLHHPNVLEAIGIFMSTERIPPSILLEYCPMNLGKAIENKMFFNQDLVKVIYQIAEGMKYIHFKKIIHRDLKPTNILIANDGLVKIADFGISKLMTIEEQAMTGGIGSQKFMAPEIINEEDHYNEKVDVYSFGVLVFYILSGGQLPKIKMLDILKGDKAKIPESFTGFSKKLINDCWNFNSKDRPSFQMIVDDLDKYQYDLAPLNEMEIYNVKIFVKQHKERITKYINANDNS